MGVAHYMPYGQSPEWGAGDREERNLLRISPLSLPITSPPHGPVGSANDGRSHTGTIMLETYFSAAKMLGHLRRGPSGPYLDGFADVLEQQGYSPGTAARYLRAAAHIGHVMTEQCT